VNFIAGEALIVELEARKRKLREFFQLGAEAELLAQTNGEFDLPEEVSEGLRNFNIEWHPIPSADAVPLDNSYFARLYPTAARDFSSPREHGPGYHERLVTGHRSHQGRIIGVERTLKPRYLPGNQQYYGTLYGFDPTADPYADYMGAAGMMNGTRYAHNYLSLRAFLAVVSDDWRARGILPSGYRVSICPPTIFNLVGTLFHPEWSSTETIELGFYPDQAGNATCYAVGANGPNDFSYISEIEGENDWSLTGFRVALLPDIS
jgi:hypothetical protein